MQKGKDVLGHVFQARVVASIPPSWKMSNLGAVLEQHRKSYAPAQNAVVPYVGLKHIATGNPRLGHIGSSEEVKSSKTYFYPKQILYGKLAPYLDKCVLVDFEGVCSTDILVFDTVKKESCPDFMVYVLHTDQLIQFATSTIAGVTHPRTSWKSLQDFEFPLPPLPEQRRISAVLNAIWDDIAAQDDLIRALREFKRSVMARLFTYGAGEVPAETKMTEVGVIPVGWEICELSTILREKIRNGAFVKKDQFGFGIPYFNVVDVFKDSHADLDSTERVLASKSDVDKYGLESGDLIFVRSSLKEEGVGHCCVVHNIKQESIFDNHLMRVRLNLDTALPEFVAYFFLSPIGKSSLISRSKKTTMTTLNQGGLAGSLIPVPPIDEQAVIAGGLRNLELSITAEENCKTAQQEFFRSMLHHLMTGQIRLLSDEGLPL